MKSRWELQIVKSGAVKRITLNTEPLPTWNRSKLGRVGTLGVLATRVFKVESTPETDAFFEYFPHFNIVTDILRRDIAISLLYAGSPVIENARVNELNFDGRAYNIIVSGRNAALIALLNKDLSDLDWAAYTIGYDGDSQSASVITDPAANDGLMYAASYYDDAVDATFFNALAAKPIDSPYVLPLVKLETIYSEILSQNGITSSILGSVDFENENDFLSEYIQLTTRRIAQSGQFFGQTAAAQVLPATVRPYLPAVTYATDTEFWQEGSNSFTISGTPFYFRTRCGDRQVCRRGDNSRELCDLYRVGGVRFSVCLPLRQRGDFFSEPDRRSGCRRSPALRVYGRTPRRVGVWNISGRLLCRDRLAGFCGRVHV